MKTKSLVLATLIALAVAGAAGYAHARGALFAAPGPDKVLAIASQQLSLQPHQQAQLRPLLVRAAKLRADVRNDAEAVMAASRAELARPDANLRALSVERQAVVDSRLLEARALRDDFIAFYEDELDPRQQSLAREHMLTRIDRIESVIDRLQALRGDPMFGP